MFQIYWVKSNVLLKLIWPVSYYLARGASGKCEMMYVVGIVLLGSAGPRAAFEPSTRDRYTS